MRIQNFIFTLGIGMMLGGTSLLTLNHAWSNSEEATQQADAASIEKASAFILETGNQIIKILINKSKPLADRKQEFRQVLREDFNISKIGKFALGKYWRIATDEQKKQYLELFEDAIVDNYAAQFDNYANEKLDIENARPTKNGGILVHSKILRPAGGEPLSVDWQVFKDNDGYKIYDIVVNGVSMSNFQRSAYAASIKAEGSIQKFLEKMRTSPQIAAPPS